MPVTAQNLHLRFWSERMLKEKNDACVSPYVFSLANTQIRFKNWLRCLSAPARIFFRWTPLLRPSDLLLWHESRSCCLFSSTFMFLFSFLFWYVVSQLKRRQPKGLKNTREPLCCRFLRVGLSASLPRHAAVCPCPRHTIPAAGQSADTAFSDPTSRIPPLVSPRPLYSPVYFVYSGFK